MIKESKYSHITIFFYLRIFSFLHLKYFKKYNSKLMGGLKQFYFSKDYFFFFLNVTKIYIQF